jgi:hypothetical protein
MSILTYGYAISGISAEEVKQLIIKAAPANESIKFIILDITLPYEQWMGHDVELKECSHAIYLETEHKFSDALLIGISLLTEGVLSLFYAQNMNAYGCSYFLNGNKVLERLTVSGSNMKDEEIRNEFSGHSTPQVIEQLFLRLTGSSIQEALNITGEEYFITNK